MKEKIDRSVLQDVTIERAQIAKWLERDIKSCYVLIMDILATDECMEALTEVFWQRYLEFHNRAKNEPGIPFPPANDVK